MALKLEEEKSLDFLVGAWKASGVVHPGRFGPGGKSAGRATYQWELGDKWLTYESSLDLPGLGHYEVSGGVSYDPQTKSYRAFAINSFGFLLVYDGRWANQNELVFDLIHPIGREKTRVVYEKLDERTFNFRSESSPDGVIFEPYFETTHSRC